MNSSIVLQDISLNGNIVRYHYCVYGKIRKYFKTDTMFLRYETDMTEVPLSILTIPFVNCMIGLSWLTGSVLFVDEVDETYFNALKDLKNAYSDLHNTQLKGMFVPSIIKQNELEKNDKYLLLFGGGVDCHSSFLRNKDKVVGLVNIYGWAKDENAITTIDESDRIMTANFAQKFEIDAYHVSSNFASQFDLDRIDKDLCRKLRTTYWYGFLHSMAFLSIVSPIAWIANVSQLMIASSFTKARIDVHCGSYITTDSEYRFATNGKTLHDGFELNRQEKVRLLVEYQRISKRPYPIQACSFNDHNCCNCEKCFRTVIAIIAEGGDPLLFGFEHGSSVKLHWQSIIERDVALWGVNKESYYYCCTRKRMLENYENIKDKEFVDWFLNFDFDKAKRKGLRRYYRQNFFSILKRKLHLV